MKHLRQFLIVLAANGILVFLVAELNSSLAPWSVSLTVGGILTVFPALKLPVRSGFPVVLLTGALLDALTPVPFGLFLFAFGFLYVVLHRGRNRFRTRRAFHLAVVACAVNLLLLLALGAWFAPSAGLLTYGARFVLEALFSETVVFALSFWFFDLQEKSLDLLGARPAPDEMT